MALIDQVKQICTRLKDHGWGDLFLQHGLDITANDLESALLEELTTINRKIKGFEDFALEGKRGIEPGHPARSLLYHALASSNVQTGVNNSELTTFPTLAELEIVENYVYGIKPPTLSEICKRAKGNLAIVVFATEYRPAPETVHKKHADVCFSRTGVARVGTVEPLYQSKNRGFLSSVDNDEYAFRVLPAHYSAYLAVQQKGAEKEFGPMRFRTGTDIDEDDNDSLGTRKSDKERLFWVPIHKLFSGTECIKENAETPLELQVSLEAYHVNEKLRRIHLALEERKKTAWKEEDIKKPPFIFEDGIAEWSNNSEFGNNLLVPVPHSKLVEKAYYNGRPLTFTVPKSDNDDENFKERIKFGNFSSSLSIESSSESGNHRRPAPEYVHVRHEVLDDGTIKNHNELENIISTIQEGEYKALHYIDYTGDGWIRATCEKLTNLEFTCPETNYKLSGNYAAYSIVTAVDFFPNCDQRELMDWDENRFQSNKDNIWNRNIKPYTLSDNRIAVNIELKNANFDISDVTMTAIVSLPYEKIPEFTTMDVSTTMRHSYLPDAASGIFSPGWDVSFDRTETTDEVFLAAYGLGSPFPEDAKLCAALSTFWPAVAPDAARTFESSEDTSYQDIWPYPTVSPLTDEEIGQVGGLPWDGVNGPYIFSDSDGSIIEYPAMEYVDYVENTLENKFSLSLTSQIDVEEYKNRVMAMFYAYKALNIIGKAKALWGVLSFQKITSPDQIQSITGMTIQGSVYYFIIYRKGKKYKKSEKTRNQQDFKKVLVETQEKVSILVNEEYVWFKHENSEWEQKNINEL